MLLFVQQSLLWIIGVLKRFTNLYTKECTCKYGKCILTKKSVAGIYHCVSFELLPNRKWSKSHHISIKANTSSTISFYMFKFNFRNIVFYLKTSMVAYNNCTCIHKAHIHAANAISNGCKYFECIPCKYFHYYHGSLFFPFLT